MHLLPGSSNRPRSLARRASIVALVTGVATAVVAGAALVVAPMLRPGAAAGAEPVAAVEASVDTEASPTLSSGLITARAPMVDVRAAAGAALAAYAETESARFAVAIEDRRTGQTYTFHADEAFRTASVVKLDILAAVLLRAQDAGRALTVEELSLADSMIRESDNDAASTLWWSIGGEVGLAAYDARLGLTETMPGLDGYWGATTTTVTDRLRLLEAFVVGPLSDYADYVLGLMSTVVSSQAWGASAAAYGGESVALKNGWVDDDSGLWMVNTVGRITGPSTDLLITVLSDDQPDYGTGVAAVEELAALVRTELGW